MKRIQKIEESLERIQPAQPDAVFLKRLEANLIAHKTKIKHVSIQVTFAAAASLALLFAANLYVLNSPQDEQMSELNIFEEYDLYPTTFKTFGNE